MLKLIIGLLLLFVAYKMSQSDSILINFIATFPALFGFVVGGLGLRQMATGNAD